VSGLLRALLRGAVFASAALSGGCATDDNIRNAIHDVNREFRAQYEQILRDNGSRVYAVKRHEAFVALRVVMAKLGMHVGDSTPELGYLNVFAPAPRPLNEQEWSVAQEKDLPKMRELAWGHVGVLSWFLTFEPSGLEIVINATALERLDGTEVSLTMRMRETAPTKSGFPRREYPPPAAVRAGLDKIWKELETLLPGKRIAGLPCRPARAGAQEEAPRPANTACVSAEGEDFSRVMNRVRSRS
jgi:hypothetical protein